MTLTIAISEADEATATSEARRMAGLQGYHVTSAAEYLGLTDLPGWPAQWHQYRFDTDRAA